MLTQLRVLDVSNNRLSSLPSLASLTQLQVRTICQKNHLVKSALQCVALRTRLKAGAFICRS